MATFKIAANLATFKDGTLTVQNANLVGFDGNHLIINVEETPAVVETPAPAAAPKARTPRAKKAETEAPAPAAAAPAKRRTAAAPAAAAPAAAAPAKKTRTAAPAPAPEDDIEDLETIE